MTIGSIALDCSAAILVGFMHLDRRSTLRFLAALPLLPALSVRAPAQDYPQKPVRIIVPYPPGGPYDVLPRIVAQWIGAQNGWPIVIDNRTGAAGLIGTMAAKQATPDGYTLLVASSSTHGSMPALKRNPPFDPINDFAPVALIGDAGLVLLVRDELPVRDVAELIALLRSKPGGLTYASGGFGSPQHLATVTMFHRAGLPRDAAVHLPFSGLPPALTALISGNAQFMFVSTGLAMQHIASGKLRALTNSSLTRPRRLPEVRTMAELGYPDFEVMPWCGLVAPAGTPDAIVARWNALANGALRDPKVREQIAAIDYDIRGGTPGDFAAFMALDIGRYKKLAVAMDLSED
jgi:tripartite-type tricarboxylate transporter receptor subunit TctC